MPHIQAGDIRLKYIEHGTGKNIVVFIHGNLGCIEWMNLVFPLLPEEIHIYAFDWRGCGDSDKPEPKQDYLNYSMKQHALDMINAIKALGIKKCSLANHSTGGIICTYMLLLEPDMFEKVFCLDPVSPLGLLLPPEADELFKAMKTDKSIAFAGLASAAPTLFKPESLAPGQTPEFQSGASPEQQKLFRLLVDKTQSLSDGIWFGTGFHLKKEYERGELKSQIKNLKQKHFILWGEMDYWIPRNDIEYMANNLPHAELKILSHVGHSCNIEDPVSFVQWFTQFFV